VFLWGTFPPNDVTHRPNPQKTVLGRNHVIWAINRENRSRDWSWALEREKKDRTGKKSPICGEAPTEAMYMKICLAGDVLDVITCAKFQKEIFRDYDLTGGSNFAFSYWFLNGPYNSAALLRWGESVNQWCSVLCKNFSLKACGANNRRKPTPKTAVFNQI